MVINKIKKLGEVYTPHTLVTKMLDLVKDESYRIESRFFEPGCGNGNFLVEILNRKLQSAGNNVHLAILSLSNIYGIDIDEDNVIESRNRLKNIMNKKFPDINVDYILEQNITIGDFKYFEEAFDVIIGNPPYMISEHGKREPLYTRFVMDSIKMNPRYIIMVIPARWYTTGIGTSGFRQFMLNEKRISELHDVIYEQIYFPDVQIRGGICYFKWDRDYSGDCEIYTYYNDKVSHCKRPLATDGYDFFIRFSEAIPILNKIKAKTKLLFYPLIRSSIYFNIRSNEYGRLYKIKDNDLIVYGRKGKYRITYYDYDKNNIRNIKDVNKYKVFLTCAKVGRQRFPCRVIVSLPIIGEPGTACTESHRCIGFFDNKETAENVVSYIKTKFFRFLLSMLAITQHTPPESFRLIPLQDFKKPWNDKELYEMYNLTQDEINFIESLVKEI